MELADPYPVQIYKNMGDFFTGRYHVGMKRYEMREHLRRRYPKD